MFFRHDRPTAKVYHLEGPRPVRGRLLGRPPGHRRAGGQHRTSILGVHVRTHPSDHRAPDRWSHGVSARAQHCSKEQGRPGARSWRHAPPVHLEKRDARWNGGVCPVGTGRGGMAGSAGVRPGLRLSRRPMSPVVVGPTGTISVSTTPPGAEVRLLRIVDAAEAALGDPLELGQSPVDARGGCHRGVPGGDRSERAAIASCSSLRSRKEKICASQRSS